MEKIMLIAGCSHAAGAEIDGTMDSSYNRQHSFGNLLAYKCGYKPINIASHGSTNNGIARNVLEWFATEYNKETMDVFVLVAWTEYTRMELPWPGNCGYNTTFICGDWSSDIDNYYVRIIPGYVGITSEQKEMNETYHRFMVDNDPYLQIHFANSILEIQYFLKMKNINYLMCNTMDTVKPSRYADLYLSQMDDTHYMNKTDSASSFFIKYEIKGHKYAQAKYGHHGEKPHALFADELYNFIEENSILSTDEICN